MQQYEDYEQDIERNSLTLKKLFGIVKLSFVRIVVYVTILLLFGLVTLSLVKVFAVDKKYESKVTFNNKQIEQGLSPWNSTMDISNRVKSSYLVSNALATMGLNDDQITAHLEEIILNLSVVALVQEDTSTETNPNKEIYAFSYKLSLNPIKSLKWTNDQYVNFLDILTDYYIQDFRNEYSFQKTLRSIQNISLDKYNYMELVAIANQTINVNINMLNTLNSISNGQEFLSAGQGSTFGSLLKEFEAIQFKITAIQSMVVSEGIQSSADSTEMFFINQQISKLTAEKAALEALCTSLIDLVEKSKPQDVIIGGSGTVIDSASSSKKDTAYYAELVENLTKSQKDLANKSSELAIWTKIYDDYTIPNQNFNGQDDEYKTAKRAFVASAFNSVIADTNEIVAKANLTIKEYNDSQVLKSFIKKTTPATEIVNSKLSLKVFILIEVLLFVCATALAVSVSMKKGKMDIAKK